MLSTFVNTLLSAEADAVCGDAYGSVSQERSNRRNGYPHRDFDTLARTIDVTTARVSRPTVIKWRDRCAARGLGGLDDEPRSGRPKAVDDEAIIAARLEASPDSLGVTHWSSRLLGKYLGVGDATVARRRYRVEPWRRESFKFSTDPELEAKVRDIVGLYLNPPTNAVVLCVDESGRAGARHHSR